MGRLIHVCRTHFYKFLVLIIIGLMALQYGLSTTFYGGKSYFYVAIPMFYATKLTPDRVTESYSSSNDIRQPSFVTTARLVSSSPLSKDSSSHRPLGQMKDTSKIMAVKTTVVMTNVFPSSPTLNSSRINTAPTQPAAVSARVYNSTSTNGSGGGVNATELPLCPALPPKLGLLSLNPDFSIVRRR